jgi:transcriptional regulator with XRE-family HTH domain
MRQIFNIDPKAPKCIWNNNTLAEQIKATGLQKKVIAKKSGLSSSELSHIISRRREGKPEIIERIQKVLERYL